LLAKETQIYPNYQSVVAASKSYMTSSLAFGTSEQTLKEQWETQ
jgi:hypothetical protein